MLGFASSKVYVEIDKSHVLVGMLRRDAPRYTRLWRALGANGGMLTCEVFDEHKFGSLEVGQGAIYNLSEICTFLSKMLDKHHLHGAKAVVCCPYLAGCDDYKKQLASLQVSLCVCKAGLRIESIYEERILLR